MLSSQAVPDVATTATSNPGHAGRHARMPLMMASVATPTARADTLTVSRSSHSRGNLSTTSLGTVPVSPKKSFTCPTAMTMPMPVVKPRITGPGMYLMYVPSFSSAAMMRMKPATNVAVSIPLYPCRSITLPMMTMKAAAGPPT